MVDSIKPGGNSPISHSEIDAPEKRTRTSALAGRFSQTLDENSKRKASKRKRIKFEVKLKLRKMHAASQAEKQRRQRAEASKREGTDTATNTTTRWPADQSPEGHVNARKRRERKREGQVRQQQPAASGRKKATKTKPQTPPLADQLMLRNPWWGRASERSDNRLPSVAPDRPTPDAGHHLITAEGTGVGMSVDCARIDEPVSDPTVSVDPNAPPPVNATGKDVQDATSAVSSAAFDLARKINDKNTPIDAAFLTPDEKQLLVQQATQPKLYPAIEDNNYHVYRYQLPDGQKQDLLIRRDDSGQWEVKPASRFQKELTLLSSIVPELEQDIIFTIANGRRIHVDNKTNRSGYLPASKEIVFSSDLLKNPEQLMYALVHELKHLKDFLDPQYRQKRFFSRNPNFMRFTDRFRRQEEGSAMLAGMDLLRKLNENRSRYPQVYQRYEESFKGFWSQKYDVIDEIYAKLLKGDMNRKEADRKTSDYYGDLHKQEDNDKKIWGRVWTPEINDQIKKESRISGLYSSLFGRKKIVDRLHLADSVTDRNGKARPLYLTNNKLAKTQRANGLDQTTLNGLLDDLSRVKLPRNATDNKGRLTGSTAAATNGVPYEVDYTITPTGRIQALRINARPTASALAPQTYLNLRANQERLLLDRMTRLRQQMFTTVPSEKKLSPEQRIGLDSLSRAEKDRFRAVGFRTLNGDLDVTGLKAALQGKSYDAYYGPWDALRARQQRHQTLAWRLRALTVFDELRQANSSKRTRLLGDPLRLNALRKGGIIQGDNAQTDRRVVTGLLRNASLETALRDARTLVGKELALDLIGQWRASVQSQLLSNAPQPEDAVGWLLPEERALLTRETGVPEDQLAQFVTDPEAVAYRRLADGVDALKQQLADIDPLLPPSQPDLYLHSSEQQAGEPLLAQPNVLQTTATDDQGRQWTFNADRELVITGTDGAVIELGQQGVPDVIVRFSDNTLGMRTAKGHFFTLDTNNRWMPVDVDGQRPELLVRRP
ncbi:MAG: hypothetical protein WED00_10540 [Aquisalimonadaceae bacterium]